VDSVRIGVLSDTHMQNASEGFLRALRILFRDVDRILHCGDWVAAPVVDALQGEGWDVMGVSGWGGAALKIELDGNVVVSLDFPDTNPPGRHQTLKEYDKVYSVDIPAGHHTARVENTGKDWFLCSFRFAGAVESSGPPLLAWAIKGKTTAVVWVRIEDRTWRRTCALKEDSAPVQPTVLVLPDMGSGEWQAEVWDTWRGEVIDSQRLSVPAGGEARVRLPVIEKDLAVRLKRIP